MPQQLSIELLIEPSLLEFLKAFIASNHPVDVNEHFYLNVAKQPQKLTHRTKDFHFDVWYDEYYKQYHIEYFPRVYVNKQCIRFMANNAAGAERLYWNTLGFALSEVAVKEEREESEAAKHATIIGIDMGANEERKRATEHAAKVLFEAETEQLTQRFEKAKEDKANEAK